MRLARERHNLLSTQLRELNAGGTQDLSLPDKSEVSSGQRQIAVAES